MTSCDVMKPQQFTKDGTVVFTNSRIEILSFFYPAIVTFNTHVIHSPSLDIFSLKVNKATKKINI